MPQAPARVRFAPSPTGRFHIGSARTALYNYLLARQTGGQFIFRIEDTDQKRYIPEAEQEFIEALNWHGITWDEGPDVGGPYAPYRQSLRGDIYREQIEEMIDRGAAYACFCTPERLADLGKSQQARKEPPRYDGLCRRLEPSTAEERVRSGEKHVVRFKTPHKGETRGVDVLRGEIVVQNDTLDDYILMKSDDFYNLVDSLEQKVLDGTVSLPIGPERIRSELNSHDQSRVPRPLWLAMARSRA